MCTSRNARRSLEWAFERGRRVLFLPDQHLGRNTAVLELGMSLGRLRRLRPAPSPAAGSTRRGARDARMMLWRGHCSVHGRFTARHGGRRARARTRRAGAGAPRVPPRGRARCRPGRLDRVHHQTLEAAPAGSRLGDRHRAEPGPAPGPAAPGQADRLPGQDGLLLRHDEPHRPPAPGVGVGEPGRRATSSTASGRPRRAHWARVALDRMLALPGVGGKD